MKVMEEMPVRMWNSWNASQDEVAHRIKSTSTSMMIVRRLLAWHDDSKVDDDRSDERSHSSNSDGSIRHNNRRDGTPTAASIREEVYSISPSAGTSAESKSRQTFHPPSTSSTPAVTTESAKLSVGGSLLGSGTNNNPNSFPFGSSYGSHLLPLPHR
ncbi:uncharacterized protein LOC123467854 [Daphnia magna]|uniref:uncharacterized protein LOC123467854 n=1 Tax=Daphnia magna TaxID=35525 RepID=UPI001E1BBD02|nr:uncharacterized protein LOC123467854 [Daphnia magna]